MRRAVWKHSFGRSGHRLVGLFVAFVLLPGIVLAVFALRTLRQEEQLAHQQIQERLERAAARTGRELELQFRQLQEALYAVPEERAADRDSWPASIRSSLEPPGSSVVLFVVEERLHALPSESLLYVLPAAASTLIPQEPLAPPLARAESAELGQKDYPRAIRIYQSLIDSSDAQLVPLALHGLARTCRKAGRLDEAGRAYRRLAQLGPARVGRLPADLLARFELCSLAAAGGDSDRLKGTALALYCDLVAGRWSLEKPRYFYYSERVRSWVEESGIGGDGFRDAMALEEQKQSLTDAVEVFLAEPKQLISQGTARYVAFWQSEPFRAVVLSEGLLASYLLPRALLAAADPEVDAALYSSEGKLVLGHPAGEESSPGLTRFLQLGTVPWRLLVRPREPVALQTDLARRRNLFKATLIFVVAVLIFGSYITIRAVKRELEVARMRAEFVSMVSHEFRSPLTGIRQLGEMLHGGRVAGEEKQRRYHQMIVQESKRLGRLVENLLDLSRMEEGRREYRMVPLKSSTWLRQLVEDFESEDREKGVSVVADIPENLPTISADREALTCAVHNLLDNAVKYSPESKIVWLDADSGNGTITVTVRDRGVGIPEADRRHIFDKFYRVDGEISRKVKGAGLGLSLVWNIVTAHGGSVECESRLGEGSTFSIRLPAGPSAEGG
jgi:signal transduction histidine kinase